MEGISLGGPGRDEGEEDLPRKQPVEINYLYTSHQQIIPHDSRKQSSNQAASKGNEKNDTHQNNDNQSPVWLLDLERKRNQEDSDRVEGLEHLDKRDAQSEVGIVGQDE